VKTLIHLKTFTIPRGVFTWRPQVTMYDTVLESIPSNRSLTLGYHLDKLYLSQNGSVLILGKDNILIPVEWRQGYAGIVPHGENPMPVCEVSSP
jgi:hypothetical protein